MNLQDLFLNLQGQEGFFTFKFNKDIPQKPLVSGMQKTSFFAVAKQSFANMRNI